MDYELNHVVLPTAHRLVLALVDVVSTCGWLKVVLAAMEIGPMIVQAVIGPSASPLLQLPFFDSNRVEFIESKFNITDIVDFLSADDDTRNKCLSELGDNQVSLIAQMCNMYPSISISVEKHEQEGMINVKLEREGDLILDKRGLFVPVFSRFYPKEKEESWWLVVGDSETNDLIDIKRISISRESETVAMRGEMKSMDSGVQKIYLMSDSFIGCDQEEDIV